MEGYLYINNSENNRLNKVLLNELSITFVCKDDCSIVRPDIILQISDDITDYNYLYISDFGRYYFIDDIEVIGQNRYVIHAKCDVLMSFKSDILNLPILLRNTEQTAINNYIPGDIFKQTVKYKTDIYKFSSGLLDTGQFILITAGG